MDVRGWTGLIRRAGPALRVIRGDESEVLIIVDDAEVAAATLNAAADAHHAADDGDRTDPQEPPS